MFIGKFAERHRLTVGLRLLGQLSRGPKGLLENSLTKADEAAA